VPTWPQAPNTSIVSAIANFGCESIKYYST